MYVMGREVPIENLSLLHPVIYLSFLAAGLAASMAIITALCSVRFRKKTSPPPTSDPIDLDGTPASNTETENDNEAQVKELPLPPSMQQPPMDPFISERIKRVTSERKAPLSLSIKVPRTFSLAKKLDPVKEDKHKGNIEGKLKAEDSVWMKTIILGEKCVPSEEEDPVIYEGRGKRIAAYHTRKQSTAFSDFDALSSSVPQSQTQNETTTSNT